MTRLPEELYHYTTHQGLLGILGSRTVYASSIHHLNDRVEFSHGLQLARDEVARRAGAELSVTEETLLDAVKGVLEILEQVPIFVFCMSEERDLLSQWRAYGEKNNGYSIGLSTQALRAQTARHGFHLSRCIYSAGEKDALVRQNIDFVMSLASDLALKDGKLTSTFGEPSDLFLEHWTRNAAAIKDTSFSEEKEWRLVSRPIGVKDKQVGFRPRDNSILPYIELDIENEQRALPITSVTIGPTDDRELAILSLKYLLSHHGLDAEIHVSDVPLR